MSERIRVAIVDDFAVVRAGLRALIDMEPDMDVIGEADSAEAALAVVREHQPDVLLLDVRLPDYSGLIAVEAMRLAKLPARVVILSNFADEFLVREALRLRVSGYLLKDVAPARIPAAIRAAVAEQTVLHPIVMAILSSLVNRAAAPAATAGGRDI